MRIRCSTGRNLTTSCSPVDRLRSTSTAVFPTSSSARGRGTSTTASGPSCTRRPGATTSASGPGGPDAATAPTRSTHPSPVRARSGPSSLLAVAGIVALLGLVVTRPREDPGRLVVALPPLAAIASILYLAVAYPSSDGDTIKGTYALAAAPALALCFGFAVDGWRGRCRRDRSRRCARPVCSRHPPVPRLVSSIGVPTLRGPSGVGRSSDSPSPPRSSSFKSSAGSAREALHHQPSLRAGGDVPHRACDAVRDGYRRPRRAQRRAWRSATTVQGNRLTIALGGSRDDAGGCTTTTRHGAAGVGALLEQRRKVVFLWASAPTQSSGTSCTSARSTRRSERTG